MLTKNKTIFEFDNYKNYLKSVFLTKGEFRGARSKLAEALRVQTSFVSRVLNGPADFSPDHAMIISEFLQHTETERDYFVLLVEYARAGTKALQNHYRKQMQMIQEKRNQIRERIQVKKELSKESQMTYYSVWYYAAIHVLVTVPGYQNAGEIARYLKLPLSLVSECLDFLVLNGLIKQEGNRYLVTDARIHLSKTSPMIARHHANWRMRSIQALDIPSEENLFFSGPISLSEADARNVKSVLLKTLEELEPTVRASSEEAVFCLDIDFFRV